MFKGSNKLLECILKVLNAYLEKKRSKGGYRTYKVGVHYTAPQRIYNTIRYKEVIRDLKGSGKEGY